MLLAHCGSGIDSYGPIALVNDADRWALAMAKQDDQIDGTGRPHSADRIHCGLCWRWSPYDSSQIMKSQETAGGGLSSRLGILLRKRSDEFSAYQSASIESNSSMNSSKSMMPRY